jgi:hypothetical protein
MNERARRIAIVAGAVVLALLSIGAGALIALTGGDERAETPSSTPSDTPAPTDEPTGSPEPSGSETPEPSGSELPILEDGHHFVYVRSATRSGDGRARVRFDLAYFYTGERAAQEAAERGDEVVNDYYIVNDNPRLRTLPLADDVEVEYIPMTLCCELQPGNIDAWLEAVLETNQTDYDGKNVPWWFTVEGGEITRIEQQYLP